jgi:hypothetical protein
LGPVPGEPKVWAKTGAARAQSTKLKAEARTKFIVISSPTQFEIAVGGIIMDNPVNGNRLLVF